MFWQQMSTCVLGSLDGRQVAADLHGSPGLFMPALERQLPPEQHVLATQASVSKVFTRVLQDGQGPLHVAADLGNTKVVRTLMQLGADKDTRDKVWRSLQSRVSDLAFQINVGYMPPLHQPQAACLHWSHQLGGMAAAA